MLLGRMDRSDILLDNNNQHNRELQLLNRALASFGGDNRFEPHYWSTTTPQGSQHQGSAIGQIRVRFPFLSKVTEVYHEQADKIGTTMDAMCPNLSLAAGNRLSRL